MGWFEVINTALNVASTASSVSVATNINKMQSSQEDGQRAYMESAQLFDLGDVIKRKIRAIRKHQDQNPQSVLVLSNFYERALRSLVASPSSIPYIEARPLFRDLYEDLEDLSDEASSRLSHEEIIQADACLDAILDMPDIEMAINEREKQEDLSRQTVEAENYLRSIEEEWKEISVPADRAKMKMIFGIILLSIALIVTCTVLPLIISLPIAGISSLSQNFASGILLILIGLFLILMYLGSIVGGIFLIIKGRNPNPDRYREISTKRNESINILSKRNLPINIPPKYQHVSRQELDNLYHHKNEIINKVLGNFGDPKKMLLAEEF